MDRHTVLQLVEIVIATGALAYGFFEYYRREKLHPWAEEAVVLSQHCWTQAK